MLQWNLLSHSTIATTKQTEKHWLNTSQPDAKAPGKSVFTFKFKNKNIFSYLFIFRSEIAGLIVKNIGVFFFLSIILLNNFIRILIKCDLV